MKNYELIKKLEELPAGAEIEINCVCTDDEITEIWPDHNHVVKSINSVDYDDTIVLS